MYPFERFTERAKKTLTLAQEEAERSHHSYIGTEHLLLGLLREPEGLAGRVLRGLGVDIRNVRDTIESVLGRNETIIIQQIIPTSRVKKVIELSFEEARRMGHEYVGTEHLLLGLLLEGEGIAAHVLSDLGVTLARVREEIEREFKSGAMPEPMSGPPSGPRAAPAPSSGSASDVENLEALLARTPIARLLRARGLDVDALREELPKAPEPISHLRHMLAVMRRGLDAEVKGGHYDRATQLQRTIGEIAAQLRQAELDWLEHLTG